MADALPLFPLGSVLFPGMLLPLHIFEKRYRRLMRDREGNDPMYGVVLTRHGREVADRPDIHDIGCAATLVAAGRYSDGCYDTVVRGGRRFRVHPGSGSWDKGYLVAAVDWVDDAPENAAEADELLDLGGQVGNLFERFLVAFEQATAAELPREALPGDPIELGWAVCARLPLDTWERQRLLEHASARGLLLDLAAILRRERDLLLTTGVGGAAIAHPGAHFSAN